MGREEGCREGDRGEYICEKPVLFQLRLRVRRERWRDFRPDGERKDVVKRIGPIDI